MRPLSLVALSLLTLAACSREPLVALREDAAAFDARTDHDVKTVRVQHCLIAFREAMPNKTKRPRDDAEKLAAEIYAKAQDGEDFAALVEEHSDDSVDGIYELVLDEKKQSRDLGVYFRGNMAKAFGDVSWRLDVGEVGVTAYSKSGSPFGWHVIKRLK